MENGEREVRGREGNGETEVKEDQGMEEGGVGNGEREIKEEKGMGRGRSGECREGGRGREENGEREEW